MVHQIDWASWVTALSTVALTATTAILAWFTWLLLEVSARPSVIATIEPNPRSMRHLDLHIQNEGSATAFNITIEFSPLMPEREGLASGKFSPSNLSVLRSGQKVVTYLNDYMVLPEMPFHVRLRWRRKPKGKVEEISYPIDLRYMKGMTRLGDDPLIQLAEEVKKIREDWRGVASGSSRIGIDVFTERERLREGRAENRRMRDWADNSGNS